jgi:hypothetical protein
VRALARVLPELDRVVLGLGGAGALRVAPGRIRGARVFASGALSRSSSSTSSPTTRQALAERVNAPGDCRELAAAAIRERGLLQQPFSDAESTLALLERCDAFRRRSDSTACSRPRIATRIRMHPSAACRMELQRALEAARTGRSRARSRASTPSDIPGGHPARARSPPSRPAAADGH